MNIEWKIKAFENLTVKELYAILQLRSKIFVVEQNCVYQDLDGKDEKALHVFGIFEGQIVACARLLKQGISYKNASIGRVVVDVNFRSQKWGHNLMQESIAGIKTHFNETKITISAQFYLKKFYETHGFIQNSEIYLEDGIPHIQMKKE